MLTTVARGVGAVVSRLRALADRGWSGTAVALYGVLQGSVLPGPSDLLFLSFAVARPARAWTLAALATAGSMLGATLLFHASAAGLAWAGAGPEAASWFGVGADDVRALREALLAWGWVLVLVSMWTPLSTKLLAALAGASGVAFAPFLLALGAGRFARTGTFAWLVRRYGARAVERWLASAAETLRARGTPAAGPSSSAASTTPPVTRAAD